MNRILVSASTLQQRLLEQPISLLRALMSDPINGTPDIDDSQFIPGTQNINLDKEGSDHNVALPHTCLPAESFARLLGKLGITASTEIVVYDNRGIFSAPRLWWMLKAIGHDNVSILDGGWPAWSAISGANGNAEPSSHRHAFYQLTSDVPQWFVAAEEVLDALSTDIQILDARSEARFYGQVDEPRQGLRRGHIPGSFSLPFQCVLDNGRFKQPEQLKRVFADRGIDLAKPIICSCGSGVTACIIGIAALLCGAVDVKVYDGAWSQWGANSHFPVEV